MRSKNKESMEQKTVKRRFWNEDLGWYEEREVATGKYKFTEEGKVAVVSEYVLGGRPAQEIVEKYHLSSRQVLFSWMDKYVNEREIVSLPENEGDMAKKTSEERMQELEAENKRLRKALELEKLRSEAYSTMIDLAEKPSTSRCEKKLAPNNRSATQEVQGLLHWTSLRAVWLQ